MTDEQLPDQTPPAGFTLEGEQTRADDAAESGITARADVPEVDGDHADEAQGHADDDDVVGDPGVDAADIADL